MVLKGPETHIALTNDVGSWHNLLPLCRNFQNPERGLESLTCRLHAEGVEVGVHRGLSADGVFGTADVDPSAQNPVATEISVESIV